MILSANEKIEATLAGAKKLVNEAKDEQHARIVLKRLLEMGIDEPHGIGSPTGTLCAMMFEAFLNVTLPHDTTDMDAFRTKMNAELDRLAAHGKNVVAEFEAAMSGLFPFLKKR